jgi:hypothetical protein
MSKDDTPSSKICRADFYTSSELCSQLIHRPDDEGIRTGRSTSTRLHSAIHQKAVVFGSLPCSKEPATVSYTETFWLIFCMHFLLLLPRQSHPRQTDHPNDDAYWCRVQLIKLLIM